MYNLFQKKPQRPKNAARPRQATRADEHFIPMLLSSVIFCWLIAVTSEPTPQIGDMVPFTGTIPGPQAGAAMINASTVRDVWGAGAQGCQMDLKAMMRAGGTTEVKALSGKRVIMQWSAPRAAAPIGCPAAPALLAVDLDDYQHMIQWKQSAGHLYFRG